MAIGCEVTSSRAEAGTQLLSESTLPPADWMYWEPKQRASAPVLVSAERASSKDPHSMKTLPASWLALSTNVEKSMAAAPFLLNSAPPKAAWLAESVLVSISREAPSW